MVPIEKNLKGVTHLYMTVASLYEQGVAYATSLCVPIAVHSFIKEHSCRRVYTSSVQSTGCHEMQDSNRSSLPPVITSGDGLVRELYLTIININIH